MSKTKQKTSQQWVFYDINDNYLYGFDSIMEIVKFRGKELTKKNYDIIANELYNALKRDNNTTRMLGDLMKVYLIDIEEDDDEQEEIDMKKFVRITSTKTIRVTPGIDFVDNTNVDAHVADRLRVSSTWAKAAILIKAGTALYPAMIKKWNTVKALVDDNVLTIGEEVDVASPEAEAEYNRLVKEIKNYDDRKAMAKEISKKQHPEERLEEVK